MAAVARIEMQREVWEGCPPFHRGGACGGGYPLLRKFVIFHFKIVYSGAYSIIY